MFYSADLGFDQVKWGNFWLHFSAADLCFRDVEFYQLIRKHWKIIYIEGLERWNALFNRAESRGPETTDFVNGCLQKGAVELLTEEGQRAEFDWQANPGYRLGHRSGWGDYGKATPESWQRYSLIGSAELLKFYNNINNLNFIPCFGSFIQKGRQNSKAEWVYPAFQIRPENTKRIFHCSLCSRSIRPVPAGHHRNQKGWQSCQTQPDKASCQRIFPAKPAFAVGLLGFKRYCKKRGCRPFIAKGFWLPL